MRIIFQVVLVLATPLQWRLEAKSLTSRNVQLAIPGKPSQASDPLTAITPCSPNLFQPSSDPYGHPEENEWLWRGWTVPDEDGERLSESFPDWLELIKEAFVAAEGLDTSYRRWFGDNSQDNVMDVLSHMAQEGANGSWIAQPIIGTAINEKTDFLSDCTDTIGAYMEPADGRFHVCPLGMERLNLPQIHCHDIDAWISVKASSVASVLLHEFTHWDEIGEAVLGERIRDIKSLPYDCWRLSNEEKILNAENYALLANDAYFSKMCGPRSDPPAPSMEL